MGDVSQGAFYSSLPPTHEYGPQHLHCHTAELGPEPKHWFATALFWLGEILGAASLFITPIIGPFIGDIFR